MALVCGSLSSEANSKSSVGRLVVLGREMVRECGLFVCMGHRAGIGLLVVGTIIGGDIGSPYIYRTVKLEQSNSLVIGLRSHLSKSGTFEVKLHNPCIRNLCLQQSQIPTTVVASRTNPMTICIDNCKPTGTLNG